MPSMVLPAPRRRAASPAAAAGYAVVRTLLLFGFGLGALALSVVASVWGLTVVLVAAALAGLVVLRARHRARPAAAAGRPYRAFVMTTVLLLGFFVLLTVASQVWPH